MIRVNSKIVFIFITGVLMQGACGPGGGEMGENGDGSSNGAGEQATGLCADDPPLESWETFGRGFVTTHCQGCHGSAAPDRYGAPEGVTFDTQEETLTHKAQILATAASDEPTMPPTGGTSEDDRQRLRIWLECFPEH
jgi:hypothetical protein